MAARPPREIRFAEIENAFPVESGTSVTPAVREIAGRIHIGVRVGTKPAMRQNGYVPQPDIDLFVCEPDGTIISAPRGHAKDWKPGRVVDLDAAVARYARRASS